MPNNIAALEPLALASALDQPWQGGDIARRGLLGCGID